jgi:hypothetical protein
LYWLIESITSKPRRKYELMKKALRIVICVAALLALSAIPALAAGDNNMHRWDGTPFGLIGQVTAVEDAGAQTLTVSVLSGSGLVKEYIGGELVVTTNASTRFVYFGASMGDEIEFSDVYKEAFVNVAGYVSEVDGAFLFIANRVTVDFPV